MSSSSSLEDFNLRGELLWEDNSEDSSESEEDGRAARVATRAPRNFRHRVGHLTRWNDDQFRNRFRLNKETVRMLEENLRDDIRPATNSNAANSSCITTVVQGYKSTASQNVKKVLNRIAALAPEYIKMAENNQDMESCKRKFYDIARFPRVIGAIDCSHVKVISSGGDNAEYFRNRKGQFSINVQVVGDSNLLIRDIVARWPNSSHNQTIFNKSRVHARFKNGENDNSVLLGYAAKKYLITSLLRPMGEAQQLFNESQIRSQNPVERLFGVLKRRIPILALGIRLLLQTAKTLIIACVVLHNIAMSRNEPEPDIDPNLNLNDEEAQQTDIAVADGNHNFREEFILYFMKQLDNA